MSWCGAASGCTSSRCAGAVGVEPMGARRVLLIAVLAAAVLIGFVAVQNLASSAVYYLTPTEARARNVPAGTAARLGGQVEAGSPRHETPTPGPGFLLTHRHTPPT